MFESGAVQTRVYFVDLETLRHDVLCLLFLFLPFFSSIFPDLLATAMRGEGSSKASLWLQKRRLRYGRDRTFRSLDNQPTSGQPTNLRPSTPPVKKTYMGEFHGTEAADASAEPRCVLNVAKQPLGRYSEPLPCTPYDLFKSTSLHAKSTLCAFPTNFQLRVYDCASIFVESSEPDTHKSTLCAFPNSLRLHLNFRRVERT